MRTVNDAIQRIEKLHPNFDSDEAKAYAKLVRKFFASMKLRQKEMGQPLHTPLFDSVEGENIQLPVSIGQRLNTAMSAQNDYGATVRNVCTWYLREVHANEIGVIERAESLYEPLIKVLENGGYFYEHHRALVLRAYPRTPAMLRVL